MPTPQPQPDDPLASAVQGYAGGDPAKAAAVMGTMMDLLQQKGGLGGLLEAFRQSGLGAQADSWAAEGPNQPISGEQVQQAFGQPIVDVIAAKLGLTPDQARSTLAQLVPAVASRMAAHERTTGERPDDLARALAMLKNITG